MKTLLKKYKTKLKAQALEIRQMRSTRKSCPNGYVYGLLYLQHSYRLMHIAYSLLRGRKYEEIEQPKHNYLSGVYKCSIGKHDPRCRSCDWTKIEAMMVVPEVANEDVCVGS